MSYRLRFRRLAHGDVLRARKWYEREAPHMVSPFLDELRSLVTSIGENPLIDFSRWLHGEVFRPLANKRQFKRFFVGGGTVCWPNGADIAPETLRATEDARTADAAPSSAAT